MGLVEKVFRLDSKEQLLGRIEWVEADLLDIFSLEDVMKGVDEVYHCGAIVTFHPSLRKQMQRVNVEGTANLVNACLYAGVKKFCHVSSVAAIGRSGQDKVIGEQSLWKTSKRNSAYAISKYGDRKRSLAGHCRRLKCRYCEPFYHFWGGQLG